MGYRKSDTDTMGKIKKRVTLYFTEADVKKLKKKAKLRKVSFATICEDLIISGIRLTKRHPGYAG